MRLPKERPKGRVWPSGETHWKSSYSDNGGNCVEGILGLTAVVVVDTKAPGDGELTFTDEAWGGLLRHLGR